MDKQASKTRDALYRKKEKQNSSFVPLKDKALDERGSVETAGNQRNLGKWNELFTQPQEPRYARQKLAENNLAVGDLSEKNGNGPTANQFSAIAENNPDVKKIPRQANGSHDHQTAAELSKNGYVVAAISTGQNNDSGHIAFVDENGKMKKSTGWSKDGKTSVDVPRMDGYLRRLNKKLFHDVTSAYHLGYHFGAKAKESMEYYVFGKRKNIQE